MGGGRMSELALRMIAENRKSKATFLDLGNCGLTSLPEELGELVWLETLVLADNAWLWTLNGNSWYKSVNQGESNRPLADLNALAKLANLRALYVNGTDIFDLSPIAALNNLQRLVAYNTQIVDLSPIAALNNLHLLNISGTQFTDLSPIATLSNLQQLDVSGTQITDLLPVAGLRNLQELVAYYTRITDLSPITSLLNLQQLYISDTPITDLLPIAKLSNLLLLFAHRTQIDNLSPIAALDNLRELNIADTQVTDLSPIESLIRAGLKVSLDDFDGNICVKNCPLTTPPIEIVSQGNAAILNYLAEKKKGAVDHLYEAKMLILGEGGAGKTSLLRRLYQPGLPLPAEKDTTKGIAIYRHEFPFKNGRTFRLNVWDFGGQEIYHATHQFFLTHRSIYVLLDDTRKDNKTVSDPGFKDWLDLIELFGGDSPVLLFQNEKGGRSKDIALAAIKGRYANVLDCFKGDLNNADAADAIRDGIDYYISTLKHIGDELPTGWIRVRVDIEERANQTAYISQQDYFDIYSRHLPFDRVKALHLSAYFHDLGVFLHFQKDPLLARTVILQNNWATEAVYALLDDETIKGKLGRFTQVDYERIWHKPGYADMHPELLALMQRFELCYALPDCAETTWLAPELLPVNVPPDLQNWAKAGDLVLHYRYAYLPKGIISRLMVRLHRFVRDPNLACITCVLFEREATFVLVELSADGREIHLRARGPERKALLSVVAADLDAINAGFQNLSTKLDKLVPCNCKICRESATPHLFDEKALLKRRDDKRPTVECPQSYANVEVLSVLDGVSIANLPKWKDDEPPRTSAPAPACEPTPALRRLKVFLAAAEELREDRDDFELHFRRENDDLRASGVYLEFVHWETLPCAVSATRSMDDCIAALKECDVFVSMFHSKVGQYAEEEFDAAYAQFKECGKPLVFTYFKEARLNPKTREQRKDVQSLLAFQEKLEDMGHPPSEYKDINDLKLKFVTQLKLLLRAEKRTTP
jgi:Leucine-rich repeat (LRR) protein